MTTNMQRGPWKRWTDADIGRLLDLDHLVARDAAEILGRGTSAIHAMRAKLASGWSPSGAAPWSTDEDELIRRATNMTAAEVGALIGRTWQAVNERRHKLGVKIGQGQRQRAHEVGPRRLVAKTCLKCGLLLDGSWYARNGAKDRHWESDCNQCAAATASPRRSRMRQNREVHARSVAKLQAITRPRANRHGEPWLDSDHTILRDADLSILEKALRLGRTWAATSRMVQVNGYTSRVGRGDPMHGMWVIHNPNAEGVAA